MHLVTWLFISFFWFHNFRGNLEVWEPDVVSFHLHGFHNIYGVLILRWHVNYITPITSEAFQEGMHPFEVVLKDAAELWNSWLLLLQGISNRQLFNIWCCCCCCCWCFFFFLVLSYIMDAGHFQLVFSIDSCSTSVKTNQLPFATWSVGLGVQFIVCNDWMKVKLWSQLKH